MYELTEFPSANKKRLNILDVWSLQQPSTVPAVQLPPNIPSGRGASGLGILAEIVLLAVMFNCSPPPKSHTRSHGVVIANSLSAEGGARLPDPQWSTPLAGRAHDAPLGSRSCASFNTHFLHSDAIVTLPHTYAVAPHPVELKRNFPAAFFIDFFLFLHFFWPAGCSKGEGQCDYFDHPRSAAPSSFSAHNWPLSRLASSL